MSKLGICEEPVPDPTHAEPPPRWRMAHIILRSKRFEVSKPLSNLSFMDGRQKCMTPLQCIIHYMIIGRTQRNHLDSSEHRVSFQRPKHNTFRLGGHGCPREPGGARPRRGPLIRRPAEAKQQQQHYMIHFFLDEYYNYVYIIRFMNINYICL